MSNNLFSKPLDFTEYFNRVVQWNAIARGGVHVFSEEVEDFQLTLVQEEAEELVEAYEEGDKVKALDALCDVFVTAAYLAFLQGQDKNWKAKIVISVPSASIDYARQLHYSWEALKNGRAALNDVCALLYQFDGCVTKALEEVLSSNDSKFPNVHTIQGIDVFYDSNGNETDPEVECRQIERRSEGRYTGVTYTIVGEGDERSFIFKSDKGKIVKPSSFWEPNLEQFC